ncbi:cadherin-like domain-containing protein, partial [Escherichia coli]|uniref:cadherin-like domain-containing protein n=1 Tax=Escherichia coli TaxID=562 RepID=UPI00398B6140
MSGNVLTGTTSPDGTVSVTQFTLAGSPTVYLAGETATIAGVGTLSIAASGAYTFTPALDYSGPVPVATYTASDGSAPDVTSTLTIAVTAVGDVFTDASETVSTAEDTP